MTTATKGNVFVLVAFTRCYPSLCSLYYRSSRSEPAVFGYGELSASMHRGPWAVCIIDRPAAALLTMKALICIFVGADLSC